MSKSRRKQRHKLASQPVIYEQDANETRHFYLGMYLNAGLDRERQYLTLSSAGLALIGVFVTASLSGRPVSFAHWIAIICGAIFFFRCILFSLDSADKSKIYIRQMYEHEVETSAEARDLLQAELKKFDQALSALESKSKNCFIGGLLMAWGFLLLCVPRPEFLR